jgi:hypothetical protein
MIVFIIGAVICFVAGCVSLVLAVSLVNPWLVFAGFLSICASVICVWWLIDEMGYEGNDGG